MQRTRKISFASYSSYIKHMGKSLDPVKALEIYDSITDESTRNHVSVCNSVLSCLVRSGKYDSSVKLFHQMKRDGLSPDIVTYSTLLAGCSKIQNGYSKALDLVQELKYNGLVMDSITYGTLLDVCASNNQCEEAEKYFELMKDEGHTPNVFHYGSLINAYSVKGNYKKADELIVNMKDVGLVPNKIYVAWIFMLLMLCFPSVWQVILTSLLKVYVKGGLFDKARELLNDLDAAGHAQNEIPYCILMDGLAKAGQIQEAKSVFDEMNEKNVKSGMASDRCSS
uniref:Pentacotripeptide-repeat region of PRORP domain-containing protein n=1 Tax=Daucus carota subsp. sativus TaxID=79200 RepID=A0A164U0V3_DAUCS